MWEQAKIAQVQQLIDDEIEESLTLEYKAADALVRTDAKRKEISKDVSAMANSAGGVIIYGIKEYQQPDKKHLPEKIDPVDRSKYSKEWLEQVISTVRPRLNNVKVYPISVNDGSNYVVYVVEIPQSIVPHQATDLKYYKRFNFESSPMMDYEINDIRNRRYQVETLVNFEVTLQHTNIVYLSVENIGTVPALDVRFEFSPQIIWYKFKENEAPPLFSRGIKLLPPGRKFSFFYGSYPEIINKEEIPNNFDVEINYFHPQVGNRITDTIHIDFMDYMMTSRIDSELEEHRETMKKAFDSLTQEIKELNKKLRAVPFLTGATGLDLSFTTLVNLKHLIQGDPHFKKIDPNHCSHEVFQEVLGVDFDMAYQLQHFFWYPKEGAKLQGIKGMTDSILEKFHLYFDLDEFIGNDDL